MNTQQQAYIEGFVKRASEYGLNQGEAIELLKQADILRSLKGIGAGLKDEAGETMASMKNRAGHITQNAKLLPGALTRRAGQAVDYVKDKFKN